MNHFACCQFCYLPLYISHHGICSTCLRLLPKLPPICLKCGLPCSQTQKYHETCPITVHWRYLIAVSDYCEPLKSAIHRFKFNGDINLSRAFSRLLLFAWQHHYRQDPDNQATYLVTVPLSRHKKWWRGFNQTELMANDFAHWGKFEYLPTLLSRSSSPYDQKELSAAARRENLNNMFTCHHSLAGKRILLLDDIVTTGSTINEISQLLYQHGAHSVDIICVCRNL